MHSMMVSKRYPRLHSLLVLACIAWMKGIVLASLGFPLQRCCIKCCPQSFQDGQYMYDSSSPSSFLLCRAAFDATLSHTGGQARKNYVRARV